MNSKTLVSISSGKLCVTLNLKHCLPVETRANTGPVYGWPCVCMWEVNLRLAHARACVGISQGVGNP
jgi:hypothetical protein